MIFEVWILGLDFFELVEFYVFLFIYCIDVDGGLILGKVFKVVSFEEGIYLKIMVK